jgi:2,4-dienoyl-CoA reductase-like NADH-dependent reductase (Old Yellow Enzyme family)
MRIRAICQEMPQVSLRRVLSPISKWRIDDRGGTHENNARNPAKFFFAVCEAIPPDEPISAKVRL